MLLRQKSSSALITVTRSKMRMKKSTKEIPVEVLSDRYVMACQDSMLNPLGWLLEFMMVNISELPPRGAGLTIGWRDLGDQVIVFSMPPFWTHASDLVSIADLEHPPAKRTLKKLQRELKRGMSTLMKGDAPRTWRISRLAPSVALFRFRNGRVSRGYRSRALRDRFFMSVTDLLQKAGDRLRTCLVCKRIFAAVKRQEYCSPKCSQKKRTAKYLARHKNALKIRRRHKAKAKHRARTRAYWSSKELVINVSGKDSGHL